MARSLFEKYGGFKTVSKIVMDFYEMALDSDQIGDYFENIDMGRLIDGLITAEATAERLLER